MSEVYYREHYIDADLCPVDFHTDVIYKNILYISTLKKAVSEIIYPENHIPNWHKNLEILYCTEGEGNVMCSGKNYDFRPGNIFIVNSENTHMITANETVKYHCIIIDHSFLQSCCLLMVSISTLPVWNWMAKPICFLLTVGWVNPLTRACGRKCLANLFRSSMMTSQPCAGWTANGMRMVCPGVARMVSTSI